MKIMPFFTFYGGKFRIAKKYPSPYYDSIIEPFAGSAGYSLTYHYRNIILNDKDEVIYRLWKYLISVKESEINSLPLKVDSVDDLKCCQEAKWLIGFWFNKGTSRPSKTPSSWMRSNIRPNSFWGKTIRNRIADQLKHIRHWKIYNKSYDELDIDQTMTWFIDPPYQNGGMHYKENKINYNDLANWILKKKKGQVIVCEREPANWLDFKKFVIAKASSGKQKKQHKSNELIWTNMEYRNNFLIEYILENNI